MLNKIIPGNQTVITAW